MKKENLDRRHASAAAIRARVAILAAERQLPKTETAWTGRLQTYDLVLLRGTSPRQPRLADLRRPPRTAQDPFACGTASPDLPSTTYPGRQRSHVRARVSPNRRQWGSV
jgi:hypothetical protein